MMIRSARMSQRTSSPSHPRQLMVMINYDFVLSPQSAKIMTIMIICGPFIGANILPFNKVTPKPLPLSAHSFN
jgi:hypothetical protein